MRVKERADQERFFKKKKDEEDEVSMCELTKKEKTNAKKKWWMVMLEAEERWMQRERGIGNIWNGDIYSNASKT